MGTGAHPSQPSSPAVININRIDADKLTRGQRIADKLAAVMGSWPFIIVQSVILGIWIALNVIAYIHHWDQYPFILLNLALSFQAAYAAPIEQQDEVMLDVLRRMEGQHRVIMNKLEVRPENGSATPA